MDNTQDIELILSTLYKDRDELTAKLSNIDKLIKKIKTGSFALNNTPNKELVNTDVVEQPVKALEFPYKSEFKFQLLALFDLIGTPCKLKELQEKYREITGSNYSPRETLRTLNRHGIIKLLRSKFGNNRGLYWVKAEWLENDNTRLKDQYKFYGFDQVFNEDNIEFE
jgi:hypothetical protein